MRAQDKPQASYTLTNGSLYSQLSPELRLELAVVLYDERKRGTGTSAGGNHACAGLTLDLMRFVDDLRLEGVSYEAIASILERRRHTRFLELSKLHYANVERRSARSAQQVRPAAFSSFTARGPSICFFLCPTVVRTFLDTNSTDTCRSKRLHATREALLTSFRPWRTLFASASRQALPCCKSSISSGGSGRS